MQFNFFGVRGKNIQEKIKEVITEEFIGSEFSIMTESAREKEIRNYIRESLWAFNSNFIMDHLKNNSKIPARFENNLRKMQEELCEDCNEIIFNMIKNFKEFVTDAIQADGYGHFLSFYDGEENEITINNKTYFVYRNN